MALALAGSLGPDIIGVANSMNAEGSAVAEEIAALGRRFFPYQCDFSVRAELYDFIEAVRRHFPVVISGKQRRDYPSGPGGRAPGRLLG